MNARRIYIDTNMLIATFELQDDGTNFGWPVLRAIETGTLTAVTSELTLAELLPHPMARGDHTLVEAYSSLLETNGGFVVVPVSRVILLDAARVRSARLSIRLPDAIHIATAVASQCDAFLSDDLRLALPSTLRQVRLNATTLDTIGASS